MKHAIRPVDPDFVEAILRFVTPTLATMIRLQLLTGMRACELVRGRDDDRSNEVWLFRPATHKTQHLGHDKVVPLGPQAQRLLGPFLDRPSEHLGGMVLRQLINRASGGNPLISGLMRVPAVIPETSDTDFATDTLLGHCPSMQQV
jgi:integrase